MTTASKITKNPEDNLTPINARDIERLKRENIEPAKAKISVMQIEIKQMEEKLDLKRRQLAYEKSKLAEKEVNLAKLEELFIDTPVVVAE